ncbi:MAG: hypothetical protein IIZ78_20775 [Clostridiales bacterium]|nr:hypothetical protein [Clostridiales bacterium]
MINRLVKTTPYIGGQIRLDLIVNRHEDGLSYVDDIHVVPVSDNIVFNESNSWATLNYSHTDNIKHLYSIIGNDMFTAPNKYNTYKWLYNDTHSKMDTYDLTYYMGMKRMRYDRYGKQFSYFCPMWIYPQKDERFLLDDSMRFELDVYSLHEMEENVVREFSNAIYNVRFTDKTLKYLNDYLSILDDKLLNINFDQYTAYIDGIYTPSGTHLNKDVKYLLTNMLTHERPLMEFDYLIADTFIQNRLIAKQLVNFNFVFNIEDILPPEHNEYMFRDMTVVCKCFAYGEEVTVKDIYSNYDFIPAYIINNSTRDSFVNSWFDDDYNVLDYKHDYLCKELVYANKESQPIIHWTLESNPTYTFNMYNGFSPINMSEEGHPLVNGKYFDQPDMTYTEYSPFMCNLLWCKVVDLSSSTDPETELQGIREYTEILPEGVTEDTDSIYINNIKYNVGKIYGDLPENKRYKFAIVIVPENAAEGPLYDNGMVYLRIAKSHASTLVFANLPQTIDGYLTDCTEDLIEPLTILLKLVSVYEKPWKIRFEDTVTPYYTQGPKANDVSSREIDFYNDRCAVEIYRYSDSMMPQLINTWTPNDIKVVPVNEEIPSAKGPITSTVERTSTKNMYNFIYRHIQWADNEQYEDTGDMTTAEYNRLLNTGYLPFYPSIGYYSLIGEKLVVDTVPEFYDDNFIEQFWFDRNRVFNLFYEVVVTDTLPVTDTNNDEIIEVFWKHLYDTIWSDGEYAPYKMNFLKDRYKYAIKFEYASLSDVSNYDFVVTFTLK